MSHRIACLIPLLSTIALLSCGQSPAKVINLGQSASIKIDDHYATFQEYGNLGEFLPRFNAERKVLNVVWREPSLAIS